MIRIILDESSIQNRKLKLHPGVFYRAYNDLVVLYHTGKQEVFTFSDTAADIFDCFQELCFPDDAIELLKKTYEIDDEDDFEQSIRSFVDVGIDKGILISEYKQVDRTNDLEKEVSKSFSDSKQLHTVTLELTYKCNERCRHCYIVDDDRKELTTEQIKSVLDELSNMNVFCIVFTGGEVFTRKDAFDILEYAYSKRFVIDIFTNGTLLDGNDYLRLKAVWPRCVHFSVYSHIAEKHDAITQVKGSFAKTMKSIQACTLIGIPVNIKATIFSETMDDVQGLVQLSESLGASIELGTNITPQKDGDLSPMTMKVSGEENDRVVFDTIKNLIKTIGPNPKDETRSEKLCGAGDKSISINPYGEAYPCIMLPICIGDISEQTMKQIWEESDALNQWRETNLRSLKKGCADCDLIDGCVFCPGVAMMRTGDALTMYEEACYDTRIVTGRDIRKGGENA